MMYGEDFALVGPDAEEGFRKLKVQVAVMGTTGISDNHCFTSMTPLQCSVKKAMIEAAEKVIVLADSSKFSISGVMPFADPKSIDTLIVAGDCPQDALDAFRNAGVDVIVADE